ncbi:MAG: sigma-70 family RNA polymerase sigma factor [Planctomycetes bacterium]|nr:sigma-70 family RNA polymerase sigma factor [Planctomycetota bacterium]
MKTATSKHPQAGLTAKGDLYFVFHPSFEESDAEQSYRGAPAVEGEPLGFMPDEVTRAWGQRMHYAAWRASQEPPGREAARWRRRYYDCRDRIVLGNRKLTFRAVQKWHPAAQWAEDLAGECQVVLIKAVAAFNPWLDICFSTYAFTCFMRALSRLSQRQAADRLSRSLPLGSLAGGEPCTATSEEPARPDGARLAEYFEEKHPLLTQREKTVLLRRYHFDENAPRAETLEQVGRKLGLSKERVRQLQCSALEKLRAALLTQPAT